MTDGIRKVSGSGVEGKKWIQVQGKKRVTKRKSRIENAKRDTTPTKAA